MSTDIRGKLFILYDERAFLEGTDDASVLSTAHSEKEADDLMRNCFGYGGCLYVYDTGGKFLKNEKWIKNYNAEGIAL